MARRQRHRRPQDSTTCELNLGRNLAGPLSNQHPFAFKLSKRHKLGTTEFISRTIPFIVKASGVGTRPELTVSAPRPATASDIDKTGLPSAGQAV